MARLADLRRGSAAMLVVAALALGAVACGDDEETDTISTPTAPAQTSGESATTDEAATDEETTTDDSGGVSPGETPETVNEGPDDSGGVVGPSYGGRGADPEQPDSPENDVPPEPGSPQEAFEQYCDENPDACG